MTHPSIHSDAPLTEKMPIGHSLICSRTEKFLGQTASGGFGWFSFGFRLISGWQNLPASLGYSPRCNKN
jgi:hypothetical protein